MLLCTGVILWWTYPPETYTTAFVGVDTVLTETWKSLPKDLQGKLDLSLQGKRGASSRGQAQVRASYRARVRGLGRWCGVGCREGVVPLPRPCYPADTIICHA